MRGRPNLDSSANMSPGTDAALCVQLAKLSALLPATPRGAGSGPYVMLRESGSVLHSDG